MFKRASKTTLENMTAVAVALLEMSDLGYLDNRIESMSEKDYDCFVYDIALTCEALGIDEYTIRNNTALMQYIVRNELPPYESEPDQSEGVPVYMRVINPETGEHVYTDYNLVFGRNRRRMVKDILACAENNVFPNLQLKPFEK